MKPLVSTFRSYQIVVVNSVYFYLRQRLIKQRRMKMRTQIFKLQKYSCIYNSDVTLNAVTKLPSNFCLSVQKVLTSCEKLSNVKILEEDVSKLPVSFKSFLQYVINLYLQLYLRS